VTGDATAPRPTPADDAGVDRLAALFDLETTTAGAYVGRNGRRRGVGNSVYGGQLVAQALRAASMSVPAERHPHSLHAYFVRAAQRTPPVEYVVTTIRDGGTLSIRRVDATQSGDVVVAAMASFKEPEAGAEVDVVVRLDAPPPDECEPVGWDALLDTRAVSFFSPKPRVYMCDAFWVRAAHPFPADPVLQSCAVTYLSNLGSGFATLDAPEVPTGGPSLDHALWIHRPVPVDDWLLVDNRPQRVGDARGTYLGSIRHVDGRLAALLGQEVLLRMPSPYARVITAGR
jgi:acyl-CoA thioesterase-2